MSAKPSSGGNRSVLGAGAAMAGACAICCAGPLLALLGAIGLGSTIGALWIPALLLLVPLAAGGAWLLRTRRARVCARPAETVDLGMPQPGPRQS